MRQYIRKPIEERFWAKVQKTDSCWLWMAGVTKRGYGSLQRGGRGEGVVYAHILSFEMSYGRSPNGFVRHSCDNTRCVNPDHLIEGTHQENMDDMRIRGRAARGERGGTAKLTEDIVREIRGSDASQRAIAKRFGISQQTISKIKRGVAWSHVEV